MDEVLQIKKGSSGYSAPGPVGLVGDSGKSSHFSSIPIDSSSNIQTERDLISTRIMRNQSLTNNEKCIEEEYYEIGDIIIDMYANLGILVSKNPVIIEQYGNIMFNGINTQDSSIYKAPINSSGKAELTFSYVNRGLCSLDGYMLHHSSMGGESPMFHHRWQSSGLDSAPATTIEASSNDVINYNGTEMSSRSFIMKVLADEIYCKLVVLFKNGLSYELPKDQISRFSTRLNIFDGYFDLININISGLTEYTSFTDEKSPTEQSDKYLGFLFGSSESNLKLCDIYFEYAHEGKIYRMNVNVIQ